MHISFSVVSESLRQEDAIYFSVSREPLLRSGCMSKMSKLTCHLVPLVQVLMFPRETSSNLGFSRVKPTAQPRPALSYPGSEQSKQGAKPSAVARLGRGNKGREEQYAIPFLNHNSLEKTSIKLLSRAIDSRPHPAPTSVQ